MREQLLLDMEHPVLKNHKAYGQELLPGLAYIDMLYQIFRERGFNFKELELRNLSIYYPMTVECGYSILLDIRCTEAKTDLWSIDIYGSKKKDDGSISEKKLYVHAEMHRIIPKTYDGEKIDFCELKAQSVKHWSLEEVYGKCRLQELVHYGYMKADGTVYATEQDILMDISAGQEASVDADDAMFHPVLIDGSAVAQ
ncbi:polyketide synthase dehydratase domain-containing protein [Ruminiclostridium josui]|uniref:polyketide synthase dehydratase domain-containing protein n=1 Tax=Ruminiclostridium josui TaxID=1499 RepID=UPI0006D20947|nr:polyketide synthase dehydratase domain-containing protein [Ruminiclostridium josui]